MEAMVPFLCVARISEWLVGLDSNRSGDRVLRGCVLTLHLEVTPHEEFAGHNCGCVCVVCCVGIWDRCSMQVILNSSSCQAE